MRISVQVVTMRTIYSEDFGIFETCKSRGFHTLVFLGIIMADRRLPPPAGGDMAALLIAVEAAERQAAAVHAECENAEANRDDVMRELNQVTEVVAAARQSLRGGKIREARLHKISEQKQLAQLQLDNTLREFAILLDEDEQEIRTR